MANWQTLSIDLDTMDVGKFYRVYTDSNGTSLLLEKSSEDLKYAQIDSNIDSINELSSRVTALESNASSSPVVNVYNTDNNTDQCCSNSCSSEINSANILENSSLKVGGPEDNVVIITYKAVDSSGDIEAGNITVIKKINNVTVDSERFIQSTLLDIEFLAELKTDGLYLNVNTLSEKTFVFSYKINKI